MAERPLGRERGSAARWPVFAVHGWGLNAAVFAPLGGAVGGRRLIALDLPGHGARGGERLGHDPAAVVADLLAAAPPRAVWLGWSLGGMLALAAAAARPERVARLVLVATAASFVARPGWPLGIPHARLERMGERLLEDPRRTVADFLTLQVLASASARPTLRRLRSALSERGMAAPSALADGLALLRGMDLRALAAGVDVATLVVGGARDRLVPPAAVRDLGARLACARTVVLDAAGHVPFLSHRDAFVDVLTGFLDRHGELRARA